MAKTVSTFTEFCEFVLARLYDLDKERPVEFIDLNELAAELTSEIPPNWPFEAMQALEADRFVNGVAAMGNPPHVEAMITGRGRIEVERRARDAETVTHAYQQNPTYFINIEGSGHQIAVGGDGITSQERRVAPAKTLFDRSGALVAMIAGLCAIGGAAYGIYRWATPTHPAPTVSSSYATSCGSAHPLFRKTAHTFVENVWPNSHANTFRNCHGALGPGQPIQPNQAVRVSCRAYDVSIASAKPGGYWYRISSPPWNGMYWSPANTFLNGDPKFGPYHHPTDLRVPKC